MRFSTILISLLGAAASTCNASTFIARQAQYPACSIPCIASAPLGSCQSLNELSCLCKNTEFISTVTACFYDACKNSTSDLQTAIKLSQDGCLSAGITLTSIPSYLPSSIVGALATSTPSATSTSTKSGASTTTSRNSLFALGAAAALAALSL